MINTIKLSSAEMLSNLKKNWYFIISFYVFILLNLRAGGFRVDEMIAPLILAAVFSAFTFMKLGRIREKIKNSKIPVKITAFITSVGIVHYVYMCSEIRYTLRISVKNYIPDAVVFVISIISVFALLVILYDFIYEKISWLVRESSVAERICYVIIIVGLCAFVTHSFVSSNVFYAPDRDYPTYDIIYTSDSPYLLRTNVFMNLYHIENDVRQPLFAVFSAPFAGFGYAVSLLFTNPHSFTLHILTNYTQVFMLTLSNILVAKMLSNDGVKRILITVVLTATYSSLLSSLMMEQYVTAYFWVVFVVYCFVKEGRSSNVALTAAAGSLLTSAVLAPCTSSNLSFRRIKYFLLDMVKSIIVFISFCFAFGRADAVFDSVARLESLSKFAGGYGFGVRILQYLHFIGNCFIYPKVDIYPSTLGDYLFHVSGESIHTVSVLGIVLLVLSVLGFMLNRKDRLTRVAALWALYSFVVLCAVGWGSPENGMILYSLYFGWAFFVLIYKLIDFIADKLHIKHLSTGMCAACAVVLIVVNCFGMKELFDFAITYYPVN